LRRLQTSAFTGHPITLTADNFDAHAGKGDIALLVDFGSMVRALPSHGPGLRSGRRKP
jgi:hypothetical protein